MKIALCSNYQWPHLGGIEIICDQLKQSWQRAGHTVTWITTDVPKGAAPSGSENVRFPAWNVLEDRLQVNCPIVSPFHLPTLVRLIRLRDVVHVHSLAPGITTLVLLAALWTRRKLIVSQQVALIPLGGSALNLLQESFILAIARYVTRRGVRLTVPTAGIKKYFVERAKLDPAAIFIAPNAYDKRVFSYVDDLEHDSAIKQLQLPPTQLRVLFVGRFVQKKGIAYIEALARALPHVHFTLVGEGVIEPKAWELVNVRTVPALPAAELRLYFSAHDLLLLPSVGEGWPLVICEAMACGMPCLISRETFENFNQDKEMFIVSDLEHERLRDVIESCRKGEIPLLRTRRRLASYADKTWDWDRTANQFLELFCAP